MRHLVAITSWLTIAIIGCSPSIKLGTFYDSECYIHTYPEVRLLFVDDQRYEYRFAYLPEVVSGKWVQTGDTILLNTPPLIFGNLAESEIMLRKNTAYASETDGYLIKRNKLFKLDSIGRKISECYLRIR